MGQASCSGEAAAFGFNAGVPVTPEAAASIWPLVVRPCTAASPAGWMGPLPATALWSALPKEHLQG
ncbi:MAG TPA: hypothetical protein VFZ72_10080 [Jiangellaceae bacterium]